MSKPLTHAALRFLVAALVSFGGVAPAAAQAPTLITSWPTVDIPTGMAIGPSGLVYIYDQAGAPSGAVGTSNPETYGVGFLRNGDLLVAEYYNHRVDVYSPGLVRLDTWYLPGLLALYLAVDGQDNVYVTDGSDDAVRVVNSAGVLVAQWATSHPSGVAYLNGLVYVAGMFNGVMSIYTPNGTPAGSFPTGCTWAEQLSVDQAGDLLLTDHGLHQLKCFKPDGTLLWVLGPSVPGYAPGTCDFFSVVAGANKTILVGDYTNRGVLVLGEQATPASSASWGSVKARYR